VYFNRLRRKTLIDNALNDLCTKGFARKDVDIGISIFIYEMSCDAARLNQLNKRVTPFGRIVRRKVLDDRFAVGFHIDGIDECYYKVYNVSFVSNPVYITTFAIQD